MYIFIKSANLRVCRISLSSSARALHFDVFKYRGRIKRNHLVYFPLGGKFYQGGIEDGVWKFTANSRVPQFYIVGAVLTTMLPLKFWPWANNPPERIYVCLILQHFTVSGRGRSSGWPVFLKALLLSSE